MFQFNSSYISGAWCKSSSDAPTIPVVNPASGEVIGTVSQASNSDVDRAVHAAAEAFNEYSRAPLQERLGYLQAIAAAYERRMEDMARAITQDMGAPYATLSVKVQAPIGLGHFLTALQVAQTYPWQESHGSTLLVKEPVGVCAMITPWNWPMNQVACKVAPALASGCTIVLKPSELAPACANVFAEILHEAKLPPGVFNMVHGKGEDIGPILSAHPLVDMVSLTGSQRAGSSVSSFAAASIKKVSLELGGKSANIILGDADLDEAVRHGVLAMMANSGQSCNAPSRMLVPANRIQEAERVAAAAVAELAVGDPMSSGTNIGPIANERQYQRVQALIQTGIDEGAHLVCGGLGRPEGLDQGFYARPTVFSRANNRMTIAREEIFGPVLTIIPYEDEESAIAIANDSPFGLSGYVYGGTLERAREVALRLRTGMVHLNGAPPDLAAPFGGYKQSGLGREWGRAGFDEFIETKAVMGAQPKSD
jgi:aldehyde dehydrogenase (NAD+)